MSPEDRSQTMRDLQSAFRTRINKFGRRFQWYNSLLELEEMQELGMRPSKEVWTEAVCAMERSGEQTWPWALHLLQQMQDEGFTSRAQIAYESAFHTLSQTEAGARFVVPLLDRLRAASPDEVELNHLFYGVKACSKLKLWQTAISLLDEMRALPTVRGRGPSGMHYNEVMQACENAGEYDWADWVEEVAEEEGLELIVGDFDEKKAELWRRKSEARANKRVPRLL